MMIKEIMVKTILSNTISEVILSLSIMLLSGFLMTRVTKKLRLPNVTAYIITGIIIGPYALDIIPSEFIANTDFLSDIALSFIAFSTGEFFRMEDLKKNGLKVVAITVFESLGASIAVFITSYFFLKIDLSFSLILSALASATAPASTMMTIRETKAEGEFVDTLLKVVALDDVAGLILYSTAISLSLSLKNDGPLDIKGLALPIILNLVFLVLGFLLGLLLHLLLKNGHSNESRLIITLSIIFAFSGISSAFDISPLLGAMAMGTAYINISGEESLFSEINAFSPPILQLFFIRSGLSFKLELLSSESTLIGTSPLILVGILYFISRIAGKYAGSFISAHITKANKEIRDYLGLALIPQAGIAIGLASLGSRTLGGDEGIALETIILSSSILYELIGPGAAKLSLYLSKSYSRKDYKTSLSRNRRGLREMQLKRERLL